MLITIITQYTSKLEVRDHEILAIYQALKLVSDPTPTQTYLLKALQEEFVLN